MSIVTFANGKSLNVPDELLQTKGVESPEVAALALQQGVLELDEIPEEYLPQGVEPIMLPNNNVMEVPSAWTFTPQGKKKMAAKAIKEGAASASDFPEEDRPDFSVKQMAQNILPSFGKQISDLWGVMRDPPKTLATLGNLAVGGITNLSEMIQGKELDVAPEQQSLASAAGDVIKHRYGSPANAKQTLQNDPIGVVGDLAAVLSGGGGVLRGAGALTKGAGKLTGIKGVETAGELADTAGKLALRGGTAIDPLGLGLNAGKAVITGVGKSNIPLRTFEDITELKGTLSESALREGFIPTEKYLDSMKKENADATTTVKDFLETAPTIPSNRSHIFGQDAQDTTPPDIQQLFPGISINNPDAINAVTHGNKILGERYYSLVHNDFSPVDLFNIQTKLNNNIAGAKRKIYKGGSTNPNLSLEIMIDEALIENIQKRLHNIILNEFPAQSALANSNSFLLKRINSFNKIRPSLEEAVIATNRKRKWEAPPIISGGMAGLLGGDPASAALGAGLAIAHNIARSPITKVRLASAIHKRGRNNLGWGAGLPTQTINLLQQGLREIGEAKNERERNALQQAINRRFSGD